MNIKSLIICSITIVLVGCGGEETSSNSEEITQDSLSNSIIVSNEEEKDVVNRLLTNSSAGDFELGGTFESPNEYSTVTEETIMRSEEGQDWEESRYTVMNDGVVELYLMPLYDFETDSYGNTIGEMRIVSDRYETAEGAHVGTSLTEFIEIYPDYKIWYTYVSDMYVIQTEKYDFQFIIDPSGVIKAGVGDQDMETMELSSFDSEAQISFIRIF